MSATTDCHFAVKNAVFVTLMFTTVSANRQRDRHAWEYRQTVTSVQQLPHLHEHQHLHPTLTHSPTSALKKACIKAYNRTRVEREQQADSPSQFLRRPLHLRNISVQCPSTTATLWPLSARTRSTFASTQRETQCHGCALLRGLRSWPSLGCSIEEGPPRVCSWGRAGCDTLAACVCVYVCVCVCVCVCVSA